jgi:hypothetical protein
MNYLIGAVKHCDSTRINNWAKSAIKYCNCEVVLLVLDQVMPESLSQLFTLGIKVVHSPTKDEVDINICKWERHFVVREFLKTLKENDLILLTDTVDVVFQKDPFEWFLDNAKKDIILTSEGIEHKDEPWNKWAIEVEHTEFYKELENKEVINSGIILGRLQPIMNTLLHMYVATRKQNFISADQPTLNVALLSTFLTDHIQVVNSDNGLVIHCGVSGPTPCFYELGFVNTYKYGVPVKENNKIINNKTREIFPIVHQYTRINEWEAFFTKLYNN